MVMVRAQPLEKCIKRTLTSGISPLQQHSPSALCAFSLENHLIRASRLKRSIRKGVSGLDGKSADAFLI